MKSFVLTTRLPHPPRSGADLRGWHTIEGLTAVGEVGVFGISSRPPQPAPADGISLWLSSSNAAAVAHMSGPADTSWLGAPEWRPSDRYFFQGIADEVAEAIARHRPDVVVLDGLMTAGYLPVIEERGVPVVLNAHNVETDLQRQIEEAEPRAPARLIRRRFTERTHLLERDVLSRVNLLWVCSSSDGDLFRERFEHIPPVTVVPNAVDPNRYLASYQKHLSDGASESLHMVFPAQFGYPPNRTAAWFLINELLPLVENFDAATITLPGSTPGEDLLRAAASHPRLTVTGAVDDMVPYLEAADVMVVPLFEGSGTRLKILEAFAAGLPVIATTKAIEGLDVTDGVHVLVAGTPDEFVEALRKLSDPGLRRRLISEGKSLVEADYSPRRVRDAVIGSLATLA